MVAGPFIGMTAVKSFLFLILAPGTVAGYIPLILLTEGPQAATGTIAWLAIPLWICGVFILLRCYWDFLVKGRGTPAPIDPPRELVVSGFYRYVRNPIYVAVLSILIGHFLWFGYWSLLIYAGYAWLATHLFVVLYEEPTLLRKFGATYDDYRSKVPRWIPRLLSRIKRQ